MPAPEASYPGAEADRVYTLPLCLCNCFEPASDCH